jgi:hypothetical protein
MPWVKFKVWWQDGKYIYNPGKVVEVDSRFAKRYIESGKAEECNAPKWALAEDVKKKKKIPSSRQRIKLVSSTLKHSNSYSDIASEVMNED